MIPRCADPELSLSQRLGDGAYAVGAVVGQLALLLALSPLLLAAVLCAGVFLVLTETDGGECVGKAVGARLDKWLKPFFGAFSLPSDPEVRARARAALERGDAEQLREALMSRGFLGLRAVRPVERSRMLQGALIDVEKTGRDYALCDAIVDSGCRVDGWFPDFDALGWASASRPRAELPKLIQWALSKGARPRANRNEMGGSLIDEVVRRGQVEVLALFDEAGTMGEWAKRAALRTAASEGAAEALGWMLSRKSWEMAARAELARRVGPTLLMRGAWSASSVEILLPLSRASQASYEDAPALARLVSGKLFFRAGAGACALGRAKETRSQSPHLTLRTLEALAMAGADMRGVGWGGATLLHRAAANKDEGAVAWLIERGLDPRARDGDGETPLMWAARARSVEGIQALLAIGEVDARSSRGSTALMLLAAAPAPSHDEEAERQGACARKLLTAGADPRARDEKGLRAVDWAARRANAELFELLAPRSEWDHGSVERALARRAVRKMRREGDVARIGAFAARSREAGEIGEAAPEPTGQARARRL